MKFGAKKNPTVLTGVTFRAKFHSKSLYSVEKKIVGISQYAYFNSLVKSRGAGMPVNLGGLGLLIFFLGGGEIEPWPVYLLGKTAAICSKARCLRVSKTERYALSKTCFEMTRQVTMPSLEGVSVTCR
jgi:hypothetical protein